MHSLVTGHKVNSNTFLVFWNGKETNDLSFSFYCVKMFEILADDISKVTK